MGLTSVVDKPVNSVRKILLGSKSGGKMGVIPTAVGGTGAEVAMKAIDGLIGSPVQRIFSFSAPIVGTVGVIDLINFFMFGGVKNIRGGLTAVIGSKVFQGALPSIGPIQLPGSISSGTGSPVAAGFGGGPV